MVQMLTRLKPLGRPKQPRPTPKLNNTTIRDFGGGLNVVDSEQNLTSKFSPVFDNMVTYTDRRAGPRFGYEMWLKLKQGVESSGTVAAAGIATTLDSRVVSVLFTAHPFVAGDHITIVGIGGSFNGITAEMLNRTHGIRRVVDANTFEIVVSGKATATGVSSAFPLHWTRDTHALGGEPVECRYFANFVLLWTSAGEILTIDRTKTIQRIWSQKVAVALPGAPIGWSYTDFIAHDIFGKELICSNGHDKPLSIDFTRTDATQWVLYLVDPGNSFSNDKVPAFDACKSAFRFFTVHDTDPSQYPTHTTEIRIAAKDTSMVYSDSPNPNDAVDIDMSKIAASPEQTVRGFATIKDALLVISPNSTTMMKLGLYNDAGQHDRQRGRGAELVVVLLGARRLLPRQLRRHGHPEHDQLHLPDVERRDGGRPGERPGPDRHAEHATRPDRGERHDQARLRQRRLQPRVQRGGQPQPARRLWLAEDDQRCQPGVSGRLRERLLGQHLQLPPCERTRHVRLLRSQQPRRPGRGRRRHLLAVRAGPVDRWQSPDPQPRAPHRERDRAVLP